MGDFVVIALLVGSLWMLFELLRQAGLARLQKDRLLPDGGPGRAQIYQYAQALEQLARTFGEMAEKKDHLNEEDYGDILRETQEKICSDCPLAVSCWIDNHEISRKRFQNMIHMFETEEDDNVISGCYKIELFIDAAWEAWKRERLSMFWSNRLLENRSAAAGQLRETAAMIRAAADNMGRFKRLNGNLRQQTELRMQMHGIRIKEVWYQEHGNQMELYVTLKTSKKGHCISSKEAAALLSAALCRKLVPDEAGRSIINNDFSTLQFVTEPEYYLLNGVARTTKDGEVVSGDNFALFRKENGQMIMSLSDGMGNGIAACRESETVVELLEKFLLTGYEKEAAVRLIHSSLLLQGSGQATTTVDLCITDLYSGECDFLKIGASTTFLLRNNWVETIASTSMPMGVLQSVDYECTKKVLTEGDFIIMVSDGVMDALPLGSGEELLKDYLLNTKLRNATELAKSILEYVLQWENNHARDDMTVLTGGFWKQ